MRVARRPRSHLLPLPLCLGLPLQALNGDGGVQQCPEGLIVCRVQLLLKDIREAAKEAVLLLLVSVHMNASILGQVIELINIIHHCHTPLVQLQELSQLLVDDTSRNIEFTECCGELLLGCRMIWLLHGKEGIPPCTCGTQ